MLLLLLVVVVCCLLLFVVCCCLLFVVCCCCLLALSSLSHSLSLSASGCDGLTCLRVCVVVQTCDACVSLIHDDVSFVRYISCLIGPFELVSHWSMMDVLFVRYIACLIWVHCDVYEMMPRGCLTPLVQSFHTWKCASRLLTREEDLRVWKRDVAHKLQSKMNAVKVSVPFFVLAFGFSVEILFVCDRYWGCLQFAALSLGWFGAAILVVLTTPFSMLVSTILVSCRWVGVALRFDRYVLVPTLRCLCLWGGVAIHSLFLTGIFDVW